jgi:hypothetical protein
MEPPLWPLCPLPTGYIRDFSFVHGLHRCATMDTENGYREEGSPCRADDLPLT